MLDYAATATLEDDAPLAGDHRWLLKYRSMYSSDNGFASTPVGSVLEIDVKHAAARLVWSKSEYRYSASPMRPGVDIALKRKGVDVGMIEVKKPWDAVPYNYTAIRLLYEGVGQLMYHGSARVPGIPLAIWFGTLQCKDGRPILSSRWPHQELQVRERLAHLGIHLILWCKDGDIVTGISEFLVDVDRYSASRDLDVG